MNENIPHTPLEPGASQGTPDHPTNIKTSTPRLIHTMKSDMADAVKAQNETLVSIALAEEKKRATLRAENLAQAPSGEPAPAPKRIGRFVIVLIVLTILVGLVVAYRYLLPKLSSVELPAVTLPSFGTPATEIGTTTPPMTPRVSAPIPSLIPAQTEKRIAFGEATTETILKVIADERTASLEFGSIKNIYLEEGSANADGIITLKQISANRLFIFAGLPTPEIMVRTLEAPFMAGLLGEEGMNTPFLVLKVSNYETGLAGMLAWEGTIARFFDLLFNEGKGGAIASDKFRDVVILDRDARVMSTPTSSIAYAFTDATTVVIARTQTALEKLIALTR